MQTVRISTAQNIDIDYEIASLGDRILARLIDGGLFVGIYLLFFFVIVGIFGGGTNDYSTALVVIICLFAFIVIFYDLICEIFLNGQSIGKRALKIKVISLDGGQATIGQYVLRWLFRMVDFTLTGQIGGLIAVAATEKKQRIGDLVAGTTLIRTHPRTSIKNVAFLQNDINYIPVYREVVQLTDDELALIHEVLLNFRKSGNHVLLYNATGKIKNVLGVTSKPKMNDEQFLKTIIKDYNYITSQVDT